MAISVAPLNRWSSKHTVVAAAVGTLVIIAIAVVIIISLAPPQVQFSIEDPSRKFSFQNASRISHQFYNFTLSANNTSRRMEVHYSAISAEIWIDPTTWYPADFNMSVFRQGYVQPPLNVTKVRWWAEYNFKDLALQSPPGSYAYSANGNWPNCTVVVKANVVFKVGLACTRPYRISVSCFPVNFVDQNPYGANCT